MCLAKDFFLAFRSASNSSRTLFNPFFVVLGMPIKAALVGLRSHSPLMAPSWWHNYNVVWVVDFQIEIRTRVPSPRELNNTVFISIDAVFVAPLACSYQLPTRFFAHSKRAAKSTQWWLPCSVSPFPNSFNLFFGVSAEPTMIVVTVITKPGVYDPMVGSNW